MATNTAKPSLDQQRAAYAWQKVQGCNSEYTNLAKAAPALIMNNGLMQTLAFYQDKGKDHHKVLNQHIIHWLWERRPRRDKDAAPEKAFAAMMAELSNADSQQYRQATQEALALLRWLRQFAALN